MSRSRCMLFSVLLLCVSTAAYAQDVLVEGPGVKVGEATVLHPHVAAEAGVNSNVFYEDASELLAPIFRLIAGMDIASEGAEREGDAESAAAPTIAFRSGLELAYQEFLTSNEKARDQRKLDVSAVGDVHFFPKSNASFQLQDKFDRASRPTNFESNR